MPKPANKLKHPAQRAFLAAYAECGNVSRAAEYAGISRESHYDWKAKDAAYRAAWEKARELAGDALEDECRRRAQEGYMVAVFHEGRECGAVRKYSDTLALALLRVAKPIYRERVTLDGKVDVEIVERLNAGRKRVAEL